MRFVVKVKDIHRYPQNVVLKEKEPCAAATVALKKQIPLPEDGSPV